MSGISVVSRARWGSRVTKRTKMPMPAKRLWIHHTATNGWHGPSGVQACQKFHMDVRKYKDIAYNFLVDTDGTVYEGRGVGYVGAHTEGDNDESHAICAMGDFSSIDPPAVMLQSIADLAVHGFREGWWPNRITGGHKDAPGAETACPGGRLHVRINDINRAIAAQLTTEEPDMTPEQAKQLGEVLDLVKAMNHPINSPDGNLSKVVVMTRQILNRPAPASVNPEEIAAAIADDLGADLAAQVLDRLRDRLAG